MEFLESKFTYSSPLRKKGEGKEKGETEALLASVNKKICLVLSFLSPYPMIFLS